MDALIVLLVYVSPFVLIGIAAKPWIARRASALRTCGRKPVSTVDHDSCWAPGVMKIPNDFDPFFRCWAGQVVTSNRRAEQGKLHATRTT
jgi:hypothetical protein